MFFGFGSLVPKDEQNRRETLDIMKTAVRSTGCRAIVQGLSVPGVAGDSILHVGRLPHADVYPHCAAVVHHAGAGTTQSALAAGVPSVGVPHLADQYYWSAQLYRLGVASKPLRRSRLTPRRLASRLRDVLSSTVMRQRAQVLGAAIRAEDGAGQAVALIERAMGS